MSNDRAKNSEAAGRYAQALLELATSATALKTLEKDSRAIRKMFDSSDELTRLAESPVFAAEDKAQALGAVLAKAKVSKLMQQFVGTVAMNRRAEELPSMLMAFEEMVALKRGASSAQIVSAKKLTAAELSSIKTQLKKSLGKTVEVETSVDPDLIGGFVVKVGSRLFDNSLKTKLDGLKLAMKEV